MIPINLSSEELEKLKNRFFEYVKIDTQSDPNSITFPSTSKQKILANKLVLELLELGIEDAEIDENGYVYATIPKNIDKEISVICFCSHMDTSPDCSGENVKPIIHSKWDGSDIILPDDSDVVIKLKDHPDLNNQLGNDIITASGLTLLGADNKAGVAAIMTAASVLMNSESILHGDIRILFTPDEEVGRGTEKLNMQKLAADFAYTIDGETLGSIENETFSADGVSITIKGQSAHPGFAKCKLENALKIASEIIESLPKDTLSPETTEGKQGFIHPVQISGIQEQATIDFIIRDFEVKGLIEKEDFLRSICDKVLQNYPNSSYDFVIKEQYRNMKEILDKYPEVVSKAIEAIKRAGVEPKLQSIRGGTDGSRL
jgi:tripeptide aminopeptidase